VICSFIVVPVIVVVIDSPNIVCRAGSMKQYIDRRYQPIDAAEVGECRQCHIVSIHPWQCIGITKLETLGYRVALFS